MITNKDIYKDTEYAVSIEKKVASDFEKALLRMAIVQVKLLHNIRSNQVEIMKSQGINLKEPKKTGTDNTSSGDLTQINNTAVNAKTE